jgi:hypothetical protein
VEGMLSKAQKAIEEEEMLRLKLYKILVFWIF